MASNPAKANLRICSVDTLFWFCFGLSPRGELYLNNCIIITQNGRK